MSRNVVVVGGTGGIGKAIVDAFLKQGCRVIASGTNQSKLSDMSQEFISFYREKMLLLKQTDITNFNNVLSLVEYVRVQMGSCDVLVNSAGVFRDGLIHETSEENFDLQFNVNAKGTFNICKAIIPLMLEEKTGVIVNVASISGVRGDYNAPIYSASKAAVINLTRAMAIDYAENGLRINAVSPSATETSMFKMGSTREIIDRFKEAIPSGNIAMPSQIAGAVIFLSSESAKHINGQNLAIDGGLSAWSSQPRQDKL